MSHDTLRVRLLAFLFLIPLALYAWSAVQAFRVDSTLRDERFMRDWSASARNDPDAAGAIPRHLFRPAYGVEGHLHQFAEDAEAIRRDHPWLALRGWLAAIGKLCALASALVAAALLARLEYDGRRSMRSQAYLLGHLAPAWRRLGRLVPLHAGLLVAALASQLLYEALWSYSHWHSHGFVALLFSLPLWLLFLGGLLMLRRLRGELLPLEEPVLHLLGRELDRVAAPGLWQWLGQIADRAGAPLPDHVVTGIEHCYFVTQAKVLLAPRGIPLEGRTLYIPLTYATVMSEAESAAIIGHELGHFAAGDTAHGASLSLLQRQVRLRIERIAAPEDGRVGLLGKPGLWAALYFLERFERAYLHWNRRQELAADKVGARVAGARVRHRAATHLRPGRTDRTPAGQPADAQPGACADRPSARELPGTGRTGQRAPPGTPLRQSPADLPADRGPFPRARRRPAAAGKAHRQRRRHAVAQPPARCRPRGKPMIPPGAQAPCPAGARDDEATRLRRFVASVPNRISIGAARGAAPLSALLGLLLLGGAWTLRDHPGPGHEAAALCLLAAAALLMCLACLQRNARNAPFLVLGQGRLRARSLSAPLDLLEVADLRLEDGVWFSAIVLELHGKALPAPSTRPLDPFAARAVSECRDGPQVRLLSPAGASMVATCRYWRPRRSSTSTWTSPAPRPGSANWARSRPVLPLHSQLQGYFHEQPGTRDLVSNLAETLGAEHEELNQAKTAEVIAHLERVIANVPPATEFTNTRKYVVLGPLLSIVPFIMTGMWFSQGKPGVGVVGLLLGLFGLFLGYQHRNSGKTPSCA